MSTQKLILTMAEKIDRAADGRKQGWIVTKMQEAGLKIDEVKFSRKKKGHESFTENELQTLSEILGTDIKA